MMDNREIGACEQYNAVRINIRECPMGPFPGFGLCIPRCIVNIEIPNIPLDDEALLSIAAEQKNRVLSLGKHYNAVALHFWTTKQRKARLVEKEAAAAIIDYAPAGNWGDALEAPIGNYANHSFKLIHNTTKGGLNATGDEV